MAMEMELKVEKTIEEGKSRRRADVEGGEENGMQTAKGIRTPNPTQFNRT